jgi:hypothetical protein
VDCLQDPGYVVKDRSVHTIRVGDVNVVRLIVSNVATGHPVMIKDEDFETPSPSVDPVSLHAASLNQCTSIFMHCITG